MQKWLKEELNHLVINAPRGIDAEYGVDLVIMIKENVWIGIQVKPQKSGLAPMSHVVSQTHKEQHADFEKKFSGKVFWAQYEHGKGADKNPELLESIKAEIKRLS